MALVALALAAGCNAPQLEPLPALQIAAASDLQDVMPKLIEAFRRDHDVEIEASYGSSGTFAQQIREGAPFDLFLSADRRFVEKLADEGSIVRDSIRPYAVGTLVLVNARDAPAPCETVADLGKPGVRRIAIANPERAPYGAAAKQVLERAGLWDAASWKVVYADSVRQALQFVQSGNADAGLVGGAIARTSALPWQPIYVSLYDPIVQYLGSISSSRCQNDARAFADFVTSEAGQAILAEHGFHTVASIVAEAR